MGEECHRAIPAGQIFKLYYSYVYECFACIFVYASCARSAHRSQKTPSTSPTSVPSLSGRISKHLEAGIYFGSASESENQTCGAEPTAMEPQEEGNPAERVGNWQVGVGAVLEVTGDTTINADLVDTLSVPSPHLCQNLLTKALAPRSQRA